MKTAVVIFPGSNCDQDVIHSVRDTLGCEVNAVWHREELLPEETDLVILPAVFLWRLPEKRRHGGPFPSHGGGKEHAGTGGLLLRQLQRLPDT